MAEKLLIYIHVPKAGGTTLQSALRWHYKGRVQTATSLERPLEEVAEEIKPSASVVAGHLHYGLHRYLNRECRYITVLRNPVARVLSLYSFILRDRRHPLHALQPPFVEWMDRLDRNQAHNGQTRMLAGIGAEDVTDAHLATAKKNLDQFLVVGLTEHFAESFAFIRRSLGWKIPLYVTRNVSQETEPLTTEVIRLVQERNRYDSELYDYGSELFADQCSRYKTLELEAWCLRQMNKITTASNSLKRHLPHSHSQ